MNEASACSTTASSARSSIGRAAGRGAAAGAIDPATSASDPIASHARRASSTAAALSAPTSSARPNRSIVTRFAPKVFVSMMSAPAVR